jgi:hypothetical protein
LGSIEEEEGWDHFAIVSQSLSSVMYKKAEPIAITEPAFLVKINPPEEKPIMSSYFLFFEWVLIEDKNSQNRSSENFILRTVP